MNLGQMNSRQQKLVILAITALAFLGSDRLLIKALTKSWKARAAQIVALQRSVTDGKVLLDPRREQDIRDRWDHIRTNALVSEPSVAQSQVLRAFDRWARESGVSLSSLRPQWKQSSDEFMTLECRADAAGNLGALTRFLYQAETDPLALKIEVVELTTRDNDGQQLTLGLQVSALLLKGSGS